MPLLCNFAFHFPVDINGDKIRKVLSLLCPRYNLTNPFGTKNQAMPDRGMRYIVNFSSCWIHLRQDVPGICCCCCCFGCCRLKSTQAPKSHSFCRHRSSLFLLSVLLRCCIHQRTRVVEGNHPFLFFLSRFIRWDANMIYPSLNRCLRVPSMRPMRKVLLFLLFLLLFLTGTKRVNAERCFSWWKRERRRRRELIRLQSPQGSRRGKGSRSLAHFFWRSQIEVFDAWLMWADDRRRRCGN